MWGNSVIFAFGLVLIIWTPYEASGAIKRFLDLPSEVNVFSKNGYNNSVSDLRITSGLLHGDDFDTQKKFNIAIVYDSSGIDKPFQMELVRSVFIALRELDEDDLNPDFIDVAKFSPESKNGPPALLTVAKRIFTDRASTIVSLLNSENLEKFTLRYDELMRSSQRSSFVPPLKVFTPRLIDNVLYPQSVSVSSLQMSQKALSIALLNRVEKVGIRILVPVLDTNSPYQMQMLSQHRATGLERLRPIKFTQPIFIDDPAHNESFKQILDSFVGFNLEKLSQHDSKSFNSGATIGVIMFATSGSYMAMQIAAEKKHIQIGWFSPNILQHEEWAYKAPLGRSDTSSGESGQNSTIMDDKISGTSKIDRQKRTLNAVDGGNRSLESNDKPDSKPYYGLYTVNFVGSTGWDNPARRRVLRELTSYTGASPRVLSAVLAYDSAWTAVNNVRRQLHFPMFGLSGEIGFDSNGFRRDGVFFGVSAVPDVSFSESVTLLQPSTWILEDTISIMETLEGQFLIREYEVATSSVLTGEELRTLANQTKKEAGCVEHIMNIVAHDPFNEMPYNYFFKEANLPESLLIPNQHGFGINVLCTHDADYANTTANNIFPHTTQDGEQKYENDTLTTTLQIACTPGMKISDPIKCFRSHLKQRRRRSVENNMPETQYQYSFGGSDLWNQPQNTKWSKPKDDSGNANYYNAPTPTYYKTYGRESVTPSYADRRADSSLAAAAADPPTTPGPPPTSKLPELRQILKAAKPFVGSCIGSTTGCAMCVLVLGRLPLGAVPAACTGPCFVGTFGSCGSLLGRVFSETTVICTELFKQGHIDTETFVADAEFGRMMLQQFPTTLQGYQILATPLVELMKKSAVVTNLVSTFALPWAHHMKYLMGRTNEPNVPGLMIHTVGFPLCNIAGQIYTFYLENFTYIPLSLSYLILTTFLLFIITLIIKSSTKRRGGRGNSSSTAASTLLYVILGRSQELVRHLFT